MEDKHQLLVKVQKLLIQLQNADPDQRFEACEELGRLPSIPDHALEALLVVTHDQDRAVADAAQRALISHNPDHLPSPIDTMNTGTSPQVMEMAQVNDRIRSRRGISSPVIIPSQGAGFWIRALARIIDSVFLLVVLFMVYVGIAFIIGIASGMAETPLEVTDELVQRLGGLSLLGVVMLYTAMILYHAICESFHGSSLGKRICGLTVVSEEGSSIGFFSALGRSFLYYIDGLFFGLVAVSSMSSSPLKQRYGDKWCGTVVVKRSDLDSSQIRPRWRFVLVLLGSVFLYSIMLFISEVIKLVG